MLVFDRKSLRCVIPPTEDCDIPTTQVPLEENYNKEEGEANVPQQRTNNNANNNGGGGGAGRPDFGNLPAGAIPIPAKFNSNRPRN